MRDYSRVGASRLASQRSRADRDAPDQFTRAIAIRLTALYRREASLGKREVAAG
jgi:hypothetical protein